MDKVLKSLLAIFLAAALLTAAGCSNDSAYRDIQETELETRNFQGFDIPVFPTAQDQLNYARSGFPNPEAKRAALNFVIEKFPDAGDACGAAALNLAYMHLEPDYRFALQLDYHNAIADYESVIKTFDDQPQVQAKAHWYIGWIYCDLLKDPARGLPYFWHIVRHFPELEMGISSPVPWVSLVYSSPVNSNSEKKIKAKKHWAGLSLLEIIRHSPADEKRMQAFDTLWEKYRHSVTTGLAIKLLLSRGTHIEKILPRADNYLALKVANPYLAGEIEKRAKELRP